ncbi:MAG TPA: DUF2339 domain-containing protein [Bryobacteraceae bacterium]|nr:DUF2339 domain-containing protein [Bryobacteraceae bacterium]
MEWLVLVLLIVLWRMHSSRLTELRGELEKQNELIRRLTGRLYTLETSTRPVPQAIVEPQPAGAPEPEWKPEPITAAPTPAPEPQSAQERYPSSEPVAPAYAEPILAGPSLGDRFEERLKGVDWEGLIGGSWLNAIGVLVLVVGISLFLGYALTELGPAGKIAIGVGVSATMLAAGVIVERKERYVIFGRGLLAGGWAALYFTVHAMHAVEAARVIESPLAGGVLLLAVACGMIAHSLRYRSQNLTLLAYASAFFALQLAPMSGLSIAGTIPLSISLLTISRHLRWPNIPIAGMVFTYFTFIFRYDPKELSPALGAATLYAYWLAFEIHDLLKLRAGFERSMKELTIFPLNAMLFVGTALMRIPPSTPEKSAYFLSTCAITFLISTMLRMRWKAVLIPSDHPLTGLLAQSHRIAISFASSLLGGALIRRFEAPKSEIGLLMEAQLLVLAGLRSGERFFCQVGAAVFGAALFDMMARDHQYGRLKLAGQDFSGWVPYIFWMAGQFYFNRWLTKQGRYYTWAAAVLLLTATAEMTRSEWTGVIWVSLGLLMVEVYLRSGWKEFRYQGVVTAALGFLGLFLINLAPEAERAMRYAVAGASGALLFYGMAFRLHRREGEAFPRDTATVSGSFLAALALWHLLPAPLVAMGWGLLGFILLETGLGTNNKWSRWQGHALIFSALIRLFIANFVITSETAGISHRILTVAPLLVLAWYAWKRTPGDIHWLDAFLRRTYTSTGVIVAGSLIRFEFGRSFAVLGWAAMMLVLLHFGLKRRDRDFLYQAYTLAAFAFFRGWATNFSSSLVIGVLTIAAFYAAQFRISRENRIPRTAFALAGSALLSILLYDKVSGSVLTIAWGAQGVALLLAGFAVRERALRLIGLGLFLICILKLFFYDLSKLETLNRIFSFIVLGLVMIGASWLYMRFREKIQRYL